jgi:putative hydrolase of the HAD superfamily
VPAAILIDLDETLVVEEPVAVEAFLATACHAAGVHELDAGELAVLARAHARELWWAAPTHPYCRRIGLSSWEGLWCNYEGEHADVLRLRTWAPEYRREAWRRALAAQGVSDVELAEELGARLVSERRARHRVFADAAPALEQLAALFPLALVTNGAACLQREKLGACGLAHHFSVVVVAADVEAAKPDPAPFERALAELGTRDAVMVGDSAENDIGGAVGVGLGAVWLDRPGRSGTSAGDVPDGVPRIATLTELSGALAMLG